MFRILEKTRHGGLKLFRRCSIGDRTRAFLAIARPGSLRPATEESLLKGFNAVQGLHREASGRIRLSADPMTAHFLLAPVLAGLSGLYPEIDIELQLSVDCLCEPLRERRAEFVGG